MILFRCAMASSICLFIPAGGGLFAGRCAEIEGVIGKDGVPFRFKRHGLGVGGTGLECMKKRKDDVYFYKRGKW